MKQASRSWMLFLLLLIIAFIPGSRVESAVPPNFTEAVFVSGLSQPTSMAFAPDGRLFVTEQTGNVRVIQGGALLATPFVSLSVDPTGERGLLGLAFDHEFPADPYIYLYYTVPGSPSHNRVSRFTVAGNQALPGSELILLELESLGPTNHNGGALHFGPDGMLYIAVGENAIGSNAQLLTNQLGKILRINPDTFPDIIPPDNPFVSVPGAARTIWAFGLRNPYTFAFQRGTGLMYINDVGQSLFEEINQGSAGANYGWPISEGPTGTHTGPIYFYPHTGPVNDSGCAITGGTFYNPPTGQFPANYVDDYFFADLCNRWIKSYDIVTDTATTFASSTLGNFIVDLDVGSNGTLYYLAYLSGAVYQITYSDPNPPPGDPPIIIQHPNDVTVNSGQVASFSCLATGTPTITYQWQWNEVDISGATGTSYTTPAVTVADNGARFRCVASNAFGTATSNSGILTVVIPPGRIIVQKETDPAPSSAVFTFTASYDADGFTLSDGQSNDSGDLPPGQYSVTENDTPGWTLTSVTCSDGSDPATIGLDSGEVVTCTFINTAVPPSNVQIQKVWIDFNGDPVGVPADLPAGFSITATSSLETVVCSYVGSILTCNDGGDGLQVPAGETYSVQEINLPAGWAATGGIGVGFTCASASCTHTVTNTQYPPTCTDPNPRDDLVVVDYIHDEGGSAWVLVHNSSDACEYHVNMAAYQVLDGSIDTQIIFSWFTGDPGALILPGQDLRLEVLLPTCQAQIDVFFGPIIWSFANGDRYSWPVNRLLAALHTDLPFCAQPPEPGDDGNNEPPPPPAPPVESKEE